MIKITEPMVDDGVAELLSYDPDYDAPSDVVARILNAVFGREVVPLHEVEKISPSLTDHIRNVEAALQRYWAVDNS